MKSELESRTALPFPRRQSIRFIYEDKQNGWTALSANRCMAIFRGEETVTEFAGKVMRVAMAFVEFDQVNSMTLTNLTISEWKIGEDGRADQDDQMQRILERIDGRVFDDDPEATSKDIDAIKSSLGIAYKI